MTESTERGADERQIPAWVYKLFTGHAYPYVRRQAKFAYKREPTPDDIRLKFWEIYPQCWLKVLQEIKTGMIVSFIELGRYEPGTFQALIDSPEEFWPTPMERKDQAKFLSGRELRMHH